MIKRNKIVSGLVVFLVSMSLVMPSGDAVVRADSTQDNNEITYQKAVELAATQVQGCVSADNTCPWTEGVKVSNSKALFGADDSISAYLVRLSDLNNNDAGYVIVSAKKDNVPIVEYSYDGGTFIDEAVEESKQEAEKSYDCDVKPRSSKVYYLGGITYVAQHKMKDNTVVNYDITTGDANNIDTSDIKEAEESNPSSSNDTKSQWESIENISRNISGGSSNPKDNIITNPKVIEHGYKSFTKYSITNANHTYKVMEDFAEGGVCYPTAAVNFMYYWRCRDKKTYGKLKDGTWKNVFKTLYKYMKTDPDDGTWDTNVAGAYKKYLKNHGFKNSTATLHWGTNGGDKVIGVLKKNRPCQLLMHGHRTYKDHGVLAIGYETFKYGLNTSSYIQIADGWSNSSYRYVCCTSFGEWNYVDINIKK